MDRIPRSRKRGCCVSYPRHVVTIPVILVTSFSPSLITIFANPSLRLRSRLTLDQIQGALRVCIDV